jgi:pentatricopeptide repeat protein
MNALCKLGEMDGAVALLIEMKGRRMIPDIVSYTTLIHGYCLEGKLMMP